MENLLGRKTCASSDFAVNSLPYFGHTRKSMRLYYSNSSSSRTTMITLAHCLIADRALCNRFYRRSAFGGVIMPLRAGLMMTLRCRVCAWGFLKHLRTGTEAHRSRGGVPDLNFLPLCL